jgi:hypothetical protein
MVKPPAEQNNEEARSRMLRDFRLPGDFLRRVQSPILKLSALDVKTFFYVLSNPVHATAGLRRNPLRKVAGESPNGFVRRPGEHFCTACPALPGAGREIRVLSLACQSSLTCEEEKFLRATGFPPLDAEKRASRSTSGAQK